MPRSCTEVSTELLQLAGGDFVVIFRSKNEDLSDAVGDGPEHMSDRMPEKFQIECEIECQIERQIECPNMCHI